MIAERRRRGSQLRGCGSRCSINCVGKSVNGGRTARRSSLNYGASLSRGSGWSIQAQSRLPPLRPSVLLPLSATGISGVGHMREESAGSPHCGGGQSKVGSPRQGPRWSRMRDMRQADRSAARHQAILLRPLSGGRLARTRLNSGQRPPPTAGRQPPMKPVAYKSISVIASAPCPSPLPPPASPPARPGS